MDPTHPLDMGSRNITAEVRLLHFFIQFPTAFLLFLNFSKKICVLNVIVRTATLDFFFV